MLVFGNRIQSYDAPNIIIIIIVKVIVIILSLSTYSTYSLWSGGRPCYCSVDHNSIPRTCYRFLEAVYERWDQRHDKETNKGHARGICVFESAFLRALDVRDSCLHRRQRRFVSCEPVCSLWMVYRRWCRWTKNCQQFHHNQQLLVFFGDFHAARMWCCDRAKVCYPARLKLNGSILSK